MSKLNILSELIKTRSDDDSREILEYIKREIVNKVEKIIEISNKEDGKLNLIIGINTKIKDSECLVLSGHIDTVGADLEKYDTNPYELVIKDGLAYGLGVIDMKCFTASVLDMLDDIKSKGIPILLVLTGDEETNLYGINNVVKKLKELNVKPKFTIIGEPTSLEIKSVSNGCYEYEVEVFGKSCHSSTPKEGINSICVMAKIVTYIEYIANEYNDLTMSCDLICGGSIINRVPDYASMSFDIRTTSLGKYNEALKKIEVKVNELKEEYGCKIILKNKLRIPPLSENDMTVIDFLSEKLDLNVSKFLGGCEAGYYKEYSGDAILFGVGDLALAHKPNEYMKIDDYDKYNLKLLEMIDLLKEIYF